MGKQDTGEKHWVINKGGKKGQRDIGEKPYKKKKKNSTGILHNTSDHGIITARCLLTGTDLVQY